MVTHRLPRLLLDANINITLDGNETSPYIPYSNDANFDNNMVVILAALLCALTCALGLNAIVRCGARCRRRRPFSHGEALRPHLPSSPSVLKEEAATIIRGMPTTTYGGSAEIRIFATDCHICLADFVDGEDLRVLPKCSHGFHAKCIDKWLESSSSCPTCRQKLSEKSLVDDSVVVITSHG